MRSINKVILIGNLTRDPETRQTPSNQVVTTFSIATNREWMTKDGRKQTSTEFHDCVAWAHLADFCSKFLKKSKLVYIEGYLKTRSWDTPDGVRKFKTEIVVQDLIMLDKKQADNMMNSEMEQETQVSREEMPKSNNQSRSNSSTDQQANLDQSFIPEQAYDIDSDLGV